MEVGERVPESVHDPDSRDRQPTLSGAVLMIDYEKFVKVWQEAVDVQEVTDKTGVNVALASSRASYLRKKGVPLKKFRLSDTQLNIEKLKKLCEG